jgi:hypothetical protein
MYSLFVVGLTDPHVDDDAYVGGRIMGENDDGGNLIIFGDVILGSAGNKTINC